MASTNKSSLGLNMWEASDKPERADFVADNRIIDEKIAKLNSDLTVKRIYPTLLSPAEVLSPIINALRVGNIVSVTATFGATAIAADSFLAIAKDFPKPLYDLRLTETSDDGADKVCRLRLTSDGVLQIIDSKVSTGWYKFTLTYITTD